MPSYVFVVIRSAFSEHTHMVNVLGVFDHMHRATEFVAWSKGQDEINRKVQSAYTIEKHVVSTGCVRTDAVLIHNCKSLPCPVCGNVEAR